MRGCLLGGSHTATSRQFQNSPARLEYQRVVSTGIVQLWLRFERDMPHVYLIAMEIIHLRTCWIRNGEEQ